ncbi:endonuclease VIII [Candidatus Nanopelagicus limnes]|uniref:Ribosomal protein uS12 methylthiotransferase RimO n=1 Tax=Candidatus Nanopelagicus limnae TaxID=1884634 RepID=A0A249JYE2_9ACTN|nr:30S ribosomal protein S12 methylthiotransferase RimO [Candidatus Nanopelagicus limnes]ASY09553.1 endonuclease VIII [Candidatus Nanopelagicus limnes]
MSSKILNEKKPRTVALVTLGCARNETDSEELAGRLAADGWQLVTNPADAEIAVINTCGFIESAKKDSIDALIQAHSLKANGVTKAVVAVGCMAERYGTELAQEMSETDAILSFDDYKDISERLNTIIEGGKIKTHVPKDRRTLLPIAPVDRAASRDLAKGREVNPIGTVLRKRLDNAPIAPLKIASGCDRRCSFCAIPYFRGSFISRKPAEIIEEAKWLADNGVTELYLVSENTTSFGKDFGDLKMMEKMLPELSKIEAIKRIRLSYLQPAEVRPTLLQAMISVDKVVPYFDLSFQHANGDLLRSMRRFGDGEKFLHLISQIRALSPTAGIRSNFIVGFPGESDAAFMDLIEFLSEAQLDAIGVFGYSDEDKTEAETLPNKVAPELIAERVSELSTLVDELITQRSEMRIGEKISVLIEDEAEQEGRAEHQGPDVDGSTFVKSRNKYRVGDYVDAVVSDVAGVDLIAQVI